MDLPPGMNLQECLLAAPPSGHLDAFSQALRAVFLENQPAGPRCLASLRQGIETAQQVALAPGVGADGGAWTARWCCLSRGGCSLALFGPSQQELNFTLDLQQRLYGGFTWVVDGAAYIFHLRPDPAGWTLSTDAREPSVSLGDSLPWTLSPSRAWEQSPDQPPETRDLFGWLSGALLAATALASSATPGDDEADLPAETGGACQQCHGAYKSGAKFCVHCGAPIRPKCAACKQDLEPGSNFCGTCGTRCT